VPQIPTIAQAPLTSSHAGHAHGHGGTYALKKEFHAIAKKIARPVVNKVKKSEAQHFISDCPLAVEQIARGYCVTGFPGY